MFLKMATFSRSLVFLSLFGAFIGPALSLKCYTCPHRTAVKQCNKVQTVETCPTDDKHVCLTDILNREPDHILDVKGCSLIKEVPQAQAKSKLVCQDHMDNLRCSCGTDLCNKESEMKQNLALAVRRWA